MPTLTVRGHSTFSLVTDDGTRIVIDPWFEGSPVADRKLADVGPGRGDESR